MSITIVSQVRSKYPTPLGPTHADFLIEVAGALGLGLVHKDTGTHITLPSGINVSQDVLMDRTGQAWDILSDGENEAKPVFNGIAPIDPGRYVAVTTTGTPVTPAPTPTIDLTTVLNQLSQIQTQLVAIANTVNAALDRDGQIFGRVGEIIQHVDTLRAAIPTPTPAPSYQGSVFGVKVVLRPVQ